MFCKAQAHTHFIPGSAGSAHVLSRDALPENHDRCTCGAASTNLLFAGPFQPLQSLCNACEAFTKSVVSYRWLNRCCNAGLGQSKAFSSRLRRCNNSASLHNFPRPASSNARQQPSECQIASMPCDSCSRSQAQEVCGRIVNVVRKDFKRYLRSCTVPMQHQSTNLI